MLAVDLSDACEYAPAHHGYGVLVFVLVGVYLSPVVSVSEIGEGVAVCVVESEVDDVQCFIECGDTCRYTQASDG